MTQNCCFFQFLPLLSTYFPSGLVLFHLEQAFFSYDIEQAREYTILTATASVNVGKQKDNVMENKRENVKQSLRAYHEYK